MRKLFVSGALALAAIAGSALTAQAGGFDAPTRGDRDWEGHTGVPVPAPVPVPETFNWYVRADIGLSFANSTSVSEDGMRYGTIDALYPFGTSGQPAGANDWSNFAGRTDFDNLLTYGFGVGYYFSPRFRGDFTVDIRRQGLALHGGQYSYEQYDHSDPANPIATGNFVDGESRDRMRIDSGIMMVNGYWDLMERGRFTPYVGGGIGLAVHGIERDHSTYESIRACNCPWGSGGAFDAWSGREKEVKTSFAGNLQAGFTWAFAPQVMLDVNYRYLHVRGVESEITMITDRGETKTSTLRLGEQHEHQIRAGIRWNVW